jgi:hypothetical protein
VGKSTSGSTFGPQHLCYDCHDLAVLKEIFKQVCRAQDEPPVILTKFSDHLFDTNRNRPSGFSPVLTVFDVLTIDNHLVANTLIDQCSIESICLIEDPKVAQRTMWEVQPSGTNTAITTEGHRIIGGRMSKYYACKKKELVYLQKNTAASLHAAKRDKDWRADEKLEIIKCRSDGKLRESEDAATLMKDCDEWCLFAGEKMENVKEEITDLDNQIAKLNSSQSDINRKLGELRKILAEESLSYQRTMAELEIERSNALEYCPELKTSTTMQELNSLISKTQHHIVEEEKNRGIMEFF